MGKDRSPVTPHPLLQLKYLVTNSALAESWHLEPASTATPSLRSQQAPRGRERHESCKEGSDDDTSFDTLAVAQRLARNTLWRCRLAGICGPIQEGGFRP